jgi:uncharacterized membrane protein
MDLKESKLYIAVVGIKNYFNERFNRSFGKGINYKDNEGILFYVDGDTPDKTITFSLRQGDRQYNLTILDIIHLIRYVRFMSIMITVVFILCIIGLIIAS